MNLFIADIDMENLEAVKKEIEEIGATVHAKKCDVSKLEEIQQMAEEFYQKVFRTTLFESLKQLQQKLDEYLIFYNFERAHFGIDKSGAIPVDVLMSKTSFLRQRFQKLLTWLCNSTLITQHSLLIMHASQPERSENRRRPDRINMIFYDRVHRVNPVW